MTYIMYRIALQDPGHFPPIHIAIAETSFGVVRIAHVRRVIEGQEVVVAQPVFSIIQRFALYPKAGPWPVFSFIN